MGAFQALSNALNGKSAPAGPPVNQVGKGGSMDSLMSGRDAMMQKLKALGLTTMPAGGEAQLESMYADHVRKNGAAATDLRK